MAAPGLQALDWMVIVAYTIATIATGLYYGRRQQTDWRVSLEAILDKMERSGCTRLALVEFDSISEAT